MSGWFYRVLIRTSRPLGLWVIGFVAWWVASGYFLFFPRRVAVGLAFYRALFPGRGLLFRLWLVWRQFHRFSGLFAERVRLARGGAIERTEEGFERIERSAESGRGGVLLMSHLGTWEVAARLFQAEGVRLMLFVGERQREQIERLQKSDLLAEGISLVVVPRGAEPETVFSAVEGLRFIQQGGMVSFAGDRLWTGAQRAVEVQFLGHRVQLPAGPHLFALATGAPLFTFFALRTRRRRYHLVAYGPRQVQAASRGDRWAAVQRSAQEYAQMLEDVVRRFPSHWFHFDPFLGPTWDGPSDRKPGALDPSASSEAGADDD